MVHYGLGTQQQGSVSSEQADSKLRHESSEAVCIYSECWGDRVALDGTQTHNRVSRPVLCQHVMPFTST